MSEATSRTRRSIRLKAAGAGGKIRTAFRVSTEALEKLGVICAMEHIGRNAWLESVIREKAKRWVVQDRAPREAGQTEAAA
jgi:hypothetical protein